MRSFPCAFRRAGRIGHPFRHPDPPAVVEAHRDRLHDVRLRGDQIDRESRGHLHPRGGLLGRASRDHAFLRESGAREKQAERKEREAGRGAVGFGETHAFWVMKNRRIQGEGLR